MNYLDFTIALAEKAGKFILKKSKKGFKIEEKGEKDIVTNIDRETEDLIIREIKSHFPDHEFLAEESDFLNGTNKDAIAKAPFIWIIDPIDGTNNFTHGFPNFCVSIALFKTQKSEKSRNFKYLTGELITGAIFNPITKEMFYAKKDGGAFLNGKKITVSNIDKLSSALVGNDFNLSYAEDYLNFNTMIIYNAQAERRLGSAALLLGHLAAGNIDAAAFFGIKPWDIAAGLLILKEAGGRATDLNGNLLDLFSPSLLASNGLLHTKLLKKMED